MEENIVIAQNPSEQVIISPNPTSETKEHIVIAQNPAENIVISPNPIIIGGLREGWNGNFLPNEHMSKFLSGQLTWWHATAFLFDNNNGSMGVINMLDGLGLVDMEKMGGFAEYTAYLHALSGVNVDQYDMLMHLGALAQTDPQIVIW